MTPAHPDFSARPALLTSGAARWLVLFATSLLLHVMLLVVAADRLGRPAAMPQEAPPPVITALLAAPPPVATAPAPAPVPAPQVAEAQPPPKPAPPRRRPPPVAASPLPAPVSAPALPSPPPSSSAVAQAVDAAAEPLAGSPQPAPPAFAVTAADNADPGGGADAVARADAASAPDQAMVAPSAAPGVKTYKVDLPPSATLSYEVRYSTRGNITSGSSVIDWRAEGATYAIRGDVSKFGFALSSFRSDGAIDGTGIAPALYAEKNARRNETQTYFQRDARQSISFPTSARAEPLPPGAQDRASILWQLSGIVRGDQTVLVPGAVIEVVVAGVRDAEPWRIDIIGEETIALETGETRAWHLVRSARPGTRDKRIDIWLASAMQWYPVKLRYTEVSGDYLDLSLASLR